MGGHLRHISALGTAATCAFLACALAAPALSPAAKLKTRSQTVALPPAMPGVGTPASATATCPRGTRVVGGGFAITPINFGMSGNSPFIHESRRIGQRQWRASATQGNTVSGTTLTSFAYCRAIPSRIKGRSMTVPAPPATPSAPTTAAAARCPGRTKAIAGGFATLALTSAASGAPFLHESRRIGRARWASTMRRSGGTTPAVLTTYVYCLPVRPPTGRSGTGTLTFPTPTTVTSAACPSGKRAGAGGFSAQLLLTAPGAIPLVWESRKAGGRWQVSASLIGGTGPSALRALAYCS